MESSLLPVLWSLRKQKAILSCSSHEKCPDLLLPVKKASSKKKTDLRHIKAPRIVASLTIVVSSDVFLHRLFCPLFFRQWIHHLLHFTYDLHCISLYAKKLTM